MQKHPLLKQNTLHLQLAVHYRALKIRDCLHLYSILNKQMSSSPLLKEIKQSVKYATNYRLNFHGDYLLFAILQVGEHKCPRGDLVS